MRDYTGVAPTHLISNEPINNGMLVNNRLTLIKSPFYTDSLDIRRTANNVKFDDYVVELPAVEASMRAQALVHCVLYFPNGIPENLSVTYQALDDTVSIKSVVDSYLSNLVDNNTAKHFFSSVKNQPVSLTEETTNSDTKLNELLTVLNELVSNKDDELEEGLQARLTAYQTLTDNGLTTDAKNVVDSILELISEMDNLSTLIDERQSLVDENLNTDADNIIDGINELVSDTETLATTPLTGVVFEARILANADMSNLLDSTEAKMYMVGSDNIDITAAFIDTPAGQVETKTLNNNSLLIWNPDLNRLIIVGQDESIDSKLPKDSVEYPYGNLTSTLGGLVQVKDAFFRQGESKDYTDDVATWLSGEVGYFVTDGTVEVTPTGGSATTPVKDSVILRKFNGDVIVTTAEDFKGGALFNPEVDTLRGRTNQAFNNIAELEGKSPLLFDYFINSDTTITNTEETSTFWKIGVPSVEVTGNWYIGAPTQTMKSGDLVFYHKTNDELAPLHYGTINARKVSYTPDELDSYEWSNFDDFVAVRQYRSTIIAGTYHGIQGEIFGYANLTPFSSGDTSKLWIITGHTTIDGVNMQGSSNGLAGEIINWDTFSNTSLISDISASGLFVGQPMLDASLETDDKSIVGAINELAEVPNYNGLEVGDIYESTDDQAGVGIPLGVAPVPRSTYSALFGVIGTKYGEGDGSTTFGIPSDDAKDITALTRVDYTIIYPDPGATKIPVGIGYIDNDIYVAYIEDNYSANEPYRIYKGSDNSTGVKTWTLLPSRFYAAANKPSVFSMAMKTTEKEKDIEQAYLVGDTSGNNTITLILKDNTEYDINTNSPSLAFNSIALAPSSNLIFMTSGNTLFAYNYNFTSGMTIHSSVSLDSVITQGRQLTVMEDKTDADKLIILVINDNYLIEEYSWTNDGGLIYYTRHLNVTDHKLLGLWYNPKLKKLFMNLRLLGTMENAVMSFNPKQGYVEYGPEFLTETGGTYYPTSNYPAWTITGTPYGYWSYSDAPTFMTGDLDTGDLYIQGLVADGIVRQNMNIVSAKQKYIKY